MPSAETKPNIHKSGRTKDYSYAIEDIGDGKQIIRLTKLSGTGEATSVAVPIPRAFNQWWDGRKTEVLPNSNLLVCYGDFVHDGGVLDFSVAWELLQNKTKLPCTRFWVLFNLPKLKVDLEFRELPRLVVLDQIFVLQFNRNKKLGLIFWSWKEQH